VRGLEVEAGAGVQLGLEAGEYEIADPGHDDRRLGGAVGREVVAGGGAEGVQAAPTRNRATVPSP